MPTPPPPPPTFWRLTRAAITAGWQITINPGPTTLTVVLTRAANAPRLTAQWDRVQRRRPGQTGWTFTAGVYRDGYGGRPVRMLLRDLVATVTEAGR